MFVGPSGPHERRLLVHGWANWVYSLRSACIKRHNKFNKRKTQFTRTVSHGSCTCGCWWMFCGCSTCPACSTPAAISLCMLTISSAICSYGCLGYAAVGLTLGFNLVVVHWSCKQTTSRLKWIFCSHFWSSTSCSPLRNCSSWSCSKILEASFISISLWNC